MPDDNMPTHEVISQSVSAAVAERVEQLNNSDRLKLRGERREHRLKEFGGRLRHFWLNSLDSFEELVASCAELGDLVAREYATPTNLFAALNLLRTRAVQVGWEVHTLASAGYADGAYARWRTLHELAVVTELLKKFGEDVATRYLEHACVKNRKVLRDYNECCEQLGYPPISEAEIVRSEEVKNQLIARYGSDFGNDWGWAADACEKGDPSFFDLRRKSGYAHWKAHYGMANHAIHAGPHGVLFRLGHPLNSDPLPLSGPSLIGIGTPLDAAAGALMHTTFSFVGAVRTEPDPNLDLGLEVTSSIALISANFEQLQGHVLQESKVHREHSKARTPFIGYLRDRLCWSGLVLPYACTAGALFHRLA